MSVLRAVVSQQSPVDKANSTVYRMGVYPFTQRVLGAATMAKETYVALGVSICFVILITLQRKM